MKLNVGSGQPRGIYKDPEWVNVDFAGPDVIEGAGIFVRCSVLELPEDWTNKFEVVHCIHMLEHLNRNHREQVFRQLYRVVAPNGVLFLEVPDFQQTVKNLYEAYVNNNSHMVHIWKTSIYGKQRYEGDAHHWGYDSHTLKQLASSAGFKTTKVWDNSQPEKMVSLHYKQEPVLLLEAKK